MAISHSGGFPRIGANRELKKAQEAYWKGELDKEALLDEGKRLRLKHWTLQKEAGLDLIPVGDFAWYDQMLNHTLMLGAVPARFGTDSDCEDIDTLFRMARGRAPSGAPAAACEMTKWFDTNYHYIVPELHKNQSFTLSSTEVIRETREALDAGFKVKPTLIGPLTWLWLGKVKGEVFDRLELLDDVIEVYGQLLNQLATLGVEWVQIDEPILVLDLPAEWKQAFESTYNKLQGKNLKILLATYFGGLNGTTTTVVNLPVEGLHIDLVRDADQLTGVLDRLPSYKVLSAGIVNGRNIWRADVRSIVSQLEGASERLGSRLWVAPSCSVLHSPVDLESETGMDEELKSWFAFAVQKCQEVSTISKLLSGDQSSMVQAALAASDRAVETRSQSSRIHNPSVQKRVAGISMGDDQRHLPYSDKSGCSGVQA